jgi:hypothetical protein
VAEVDMSRSAVTERLLRVAALLRTRGIVLKGVDMSPRAVSERLRTAGALSDLCRRLAPLGQQLRKP